LPIRVLLADDSDALRHAIARHLETDPRIELVGQANEFKRAVQLVAECDPDVVLLDLRMTTTVDADEQGIRQICECKTIAMSASLDDETLALVGRVKADAFIDKMYLYEKLIPTILALMAGPDATEAV
jgi:two-component system, NarL family, response regulator LiaR